MRRRTVVMYMEIGCFVSCLCGWMLICSTLATEYWIISESASVVLSAGDYYSNLWMDCVSDTTGVSDCKYYPFHDGPACVPPCVQGSGCGLCDLWFLGAVLALIGMKCTKIGGSELANARVTFAAALTYMASGFCGMIVYSWWGDKVRSDFVDPYYLELKFELGAGLFIGWGGSCLVICGSAVMCYFSGKESFPKRFNKQLRRPPTYMTARTRRTYMLPGSSRPTTVFISPSHQSYSESRGRRESRTQESQSSGTVRPAWPPIDSAV